ncbi:MAG: hypothetical protein FJX72_16305 [Armatimonadetes bacterium]|nr:hypothetical protein [Armatimonadota bacterium]
MMGSPQSGGMALKSDGTVLAWGRGFEGQLGDGRFDTYVATPQPVPGLSRIGLVAGGLYHAFAAERPNTEPVADDQIVDALPNVGKAITLTGSDGDGDALTYTVTQMPANGTLTGTPPNMTYTSIGEFGGPDTFQFTVDDGNLESEPATVTVNVARTDSKTYTIDRTGVGASAVLLRGYLYRKSDNAGLGSKTLAFSIAGTQVGTAATSAAGAASLSWVIDTGPATRQIRVDFAGDLTFEPSFGAATLTVVTYDSTLLVPNRAGEIGDAVSLRAYLYRSPQALAVANKTVGFVVDGTSVGSAVTNSNGRALLSWVVPDTLAPGAHALVADWPGDAGYRPSSGAATLTVDKGVTYLWALSRSMARGTSAYLRAYLRRLPDYVWLAGKDVRISVDGTVVGSAPTDSGGRASVLYAAPSGMATGDHQILAEFAGDGRYVPSAATGVLTVTP